MAKYEITYKCGHTGTVDLFGKQSERDKKIAWYENNCVCPECYAKEQAEKRAQEVAEYALPELTGTEKQVAWAEKIRSKFIELRNEREKENEKMFSIPNTPQDKIDLLKKLFLDFCAEFFRETRASVWIDRNNNCDSYSFTKTFKIYIQNHSQGVN